MAAILALVEQLLGIAGQILGIVTGLRGAVENAAQEHQKYAIETIASNGTNTVNNPTYGLSALRTLIRGISNNDANSLQTILDALAAVPDPVNLPSDPPANWASDLTDPIWSSYGFFWDINTKSSVQRTLYSMVQLGALAGQGKAGLEGFNDGRKPWVQWYGMDAWNLMFNDQVGWAANAYPPPAEPDWTLWNGTDSLTTFLAAQTGVAWDTSGPFDTSTGLQWAWTPTGASYTWWRCIYPAWMLPYLSGRALTADYTTILDAIDDAVTAINLHSDGVQTAIETAITNAQTAINAHTDSAVTAINAHADANATAIEAHVDASLATLQTNLLNVFNSVALKRHVPGQYTGSFTTSFSAPQVITTPTVITAHCTGIEVLVSNPPVGGSKWTVGTYTYHRYIGSVAFIDPGNRAEPFQYLGWDTAIYTPKSMNFAEKVAITPANGVTLTVRTFTGN